ncbi:putative esterase/lipase [Thermoascus aurantiacus ATCC 26904]
MSLFNLLTYLRLKLFALFLRTSLRLLRGLPRAHPDGVLHIPSRDPGRTIKLHVYHGQPSVKPQPVLINFHGSGFVVPVHGHDDEFCRLVSREAGYTVLDVQYRLAPEHPFPAALHDGEDVVRWVLEKGRAGEEFDKERIAVSGFSAGGNIALVLSSSFSSSSSSSSSPSTFPRGKQIFRSVLAFYPPTDISIDPASKLPPDTDPAGRPLPPFLARFFNRSYIPPGFDARDPRISPSFAPASAFPANVLIVTAAWDNLANEAEALAAKIKEAEGEGSGRYVVCRRMEKCDHAWDKGVYEEGTVQGKAKKEAYALAVEMLRR